MKQVELMTERCLIPVRVFELMVKSKEIMVRGTKDRISSNRYSLTLCIRMGYSFLFDTINLR